MKKKMVVVSTMLTIIAMLLIAMSQKVNAESEVRKGNITLTTQQAKQNEKVYVEVPEDQKNKKIWGYIAGGGQYITVEFKDTDTDNPYFIMPSNAQMGAKYSMSLYDVFDYTGDINLDNVVDEQDYNMLKQYLAGWNIDLNEEQLKRADVYEDGQVNAKDVQKLNQYINSGDINAKKTVQISYQNKSSQNYVEVIEEEDTSFGNELDFQIDIVTSEASRGDKVFVNISGSNYENIDIYPYIGNAASQYIRVKLEDINTNNPYFIMPSNAKIGTSFRLAGICRVASTVNGKETEISGKSSKNAVKVVEEKQLITIDTIGVNGDENISGDKVYLNLKTSGEKVNVATADIINVETGEKWFVSIKDVNTNPYIDLRNTWERPNLKSGALEEGRYCIVCVYLNPGTTNVKYDYEGVAYFNIINNDSEDNTDEQNIIDEGKYIINKFAFYDNTTEIVKGGRIYFSYDISNIEDIEYISVFASSKDGKTKNVGGYLTNIREEMPYLDLSKTTEISEGKYYVSDIFFFTKDDETIHYSMNSEGSSVRKLEQNLEFTITEPVKEEITTQSNIKTGENTYAKQENDAISAIQIVVISVTVIGVVLLIGLLILLRDKKKKLN